MKNSDLKRKVVFYPFLPDQINNPYWAILSHSLGEAGCEILDDPHVRFSLKWLIHNRNKARIFHLHYIQSLFCNSGKTRARLIYVFTVALKMIFARVTGYRVVFTLHNLEPTTKLSPYWIDYLGHWVAANLSDRVIVHCDQAKLLLRKVYGRRRAVYVVDHPNYLSQYQNDVTQSDARNALNVPQDVKFFLFFGGIRPNKGLELLIRAFLTLKDDNFRLMIVGNDKDHETYYEKLVKSSFFDCRISFHNEFIPEQNVQYYFKASDIVVLPFSKILTSGSALLSMSFGRPVIAPRLGCLPELIEPDGGWLFMPKDPVSLAETMQLAATQDYKKFGESAFKKVSEYTPGRFAHQTLNAYFG